MTPPGATTRSADPLRVHPALVAGRDAVVVAAPAKLNLFLEILGKRPDGYHDLESLMVAVDLFDTLEIRTTSKTAIFLSFATRLPSPAGRITSFTRPRPPSTRPLTGQTLGPKFA